MIRYSACPFWKATNAPNITRKGQARRRGILNLIPCLVQGSRNKFYMYALTFKTLTLKTHEIKHTTTVKSTSEKKLNL